MQKKSTILQHWKTLLTPRQERLFAVTTEDGSGPTRNKIATTMPIRPINADGNGSNTSPTISATKRLTNNHAPSVNPAGTPHNHTLTPITKGANNFHLEVNAFIKNLLRLTLLEHLLKCLFIIVTK